MRLSGISVCTRLAVANQKRRIMLETGTSEPEPAESCPRSGGWVPSALSWRVRFGPRTMSIRGTAPLETSQ